MIIALGTPGAGKSTVLAELKKGSSGWHIINYGDKMFEIASQQGLVKTRDDIRKLTISQQAKLQSAVAYELSSMKRKIILDTHCSIRTPNGYYPGLPFELLKHLRVEALVLITAPVADILGRRSSDESRQRDAQSEQELDEHERINEAYLAAYSAFTGAPALIIENADGKLDVAVEKFERLLASFR